MTLRPSLSVFGVSAPVGDQTIVAIDPQLPGRDDEPLETVLEGHVVRKDLLAGPDTPDFFAEDLTSAFQLPQPRRGIGLAALADLAQEF
nr:hypothetical protein [Aminithiophilus ramosus]